MSWLRILLFPANKNELLTIGNCGIFVTWPLQPLKQPQKMQKLNKTVLIGQASFLWGLSYCFMDFKNIFGLLMAFELKAMASTASKMASKIQNIHQISIRQP